MATSNEKSKAKTKQRGSSNEANPIDKHVGSRIKLRRSILGVSQEQLAKMLGITFQQVQKYENGVNRVGASRLYDIGKVLDVSVDFFFCDIDKSVEEQSPRMLTLNVPAKENVLCVHEDMAEMDVDPMKRQETLELVNAYYAITDRDLARRMLDLIVQLAEKGETSDSSAK